MADKPRTKRDLEKLSEEVSTGVANRMGADKAPRQSYQCDVDFRCGTYNCKEPDECHDHFACKNY